MRYSKLDGLRGLLSLMVALNHAYMVVTIPVFANIWSQNILEFHSLQSKLQQVLMLIGNGGFAVTIFFVLSGFVLGESSKKFNLSLPNSINFFIRRLLRLYPVYLLLVIFSAIYMYVGFDYQIYPAASQWFLWWMNFQMTLKEFLLNISFIHTYLGGVTWTLRVIVIASFIFPLMYYIFKHLGKYLNLGITLLLLIMSFTILNIKNFNDLRFLYMFYLGLTISQWKEFFASIKVSYIKWLTPPVIFFALYIRYHADIYQAMIFESLVAWLIIGVLTYNQQGFKFFENKSFQFLGKISYSLYLVNFTVLYLLSKTILEIVPPALLLNNYFISHTLIFLASFALTIVVSILVYKYIEIPAQELSRKVKLT